MPVDDVWFTPPSSETHVVWSICSHVLCATVMLFSKIWFRIFNHTTTYNEDILHDAVLRRPPGRPLVTVSNHSSLMDAPLMAGLFKWSYLLNLRLRIFRAPGAKDICFRSYGQALMMTLIRSLPIVRGEGVYQKPMDYMVEELNMGEWIHIFPEGKINMYGDFIRFKWGVGRLIADCTVSPIVIPFWHKGMEEVMPTVKPYTLHRNKKITVVYGQPMQFGKLVARMRRENKSEETIRKAITDSIQEEMMRLKSETEAKHLNNS